VCRPHTRQLVQVTDQPPKRLPQVLAVVLIEKFKDLEVPPATFRPGVTEHYCGSNHHTAGNGICFEPTKL
jgi:hypothetical protein